MVGVGGLVGLQCDRVRGQSSDLQSSGDAGHDVFVGHVPVQQQDLDQRACPGGVAVRFVYLCVPETLSMLVSLLRARSRRLA